MITGQTQRRSLTGIRNNKYIGLVTQGSTGPDPAPSPAAWQALSGADAGVRSDNLKHPRV